PSFALLRRKSQASTIKMRPVLVGGVPSFFCVIVLEKYKKPRLTSGRLCPGLDSNQHTLRRCYLKTVRLPISPPGHQPGEPGSLFGGANIRKDERTTKNWAVFLLLRHVTDFGDDKGNAGPPADR